MATSPTKAMAAPNAIDPQARRPGIRRTAWLLAAVAVGVYVAFLASAVLP